MATSETIFDKVRRSCKYVADNASDVKIKEEAIDSFLSDLKTDVFKKKSAHVNFPLKFASLEEEINFLTILDILNFGSGFRKCLHQMCDRGAYDTIRFGLIGMHLSGKTLDSGYLSSVSLGEVSELFNIPLSVEKEVMAAVKQLVPSACRSLAELITKVLNDCGRILRNRGSKNFGEFVLGILSSKGTSSAHLVEGLMDTFPAFCDKAEYKGQEVFILKKVQLLAADLYRKFGSGDERFSFVDIDHLTVFSDNVVPAVLRKLGVLEYSEKLAAEVDVGNVLKPGDMEVEIRACSIVACDEIVKRSSGRFQDIKMDAVSLDFYLWTIGKDEQYRGLERHYTQETVFY